MHPGPTRSLGDRIETGSGKPDRWQTLLCRIHFFGSLSAELREVSGKTKPVWNKNELGLVLTH